MFKIDRSKSFTDERDFHIASSNFQVSLHVRHCSCQKFWQKLLKISLRHLSPNKTKKFMSDTFFFKVLK